MSTRLDQELYTFAEEVITVADSSTRLTVSNVLSTPKPREVEVFVNTAQMRFRADGTDPTSSVGEILNPMDRLTLRSHADMWNFRGIRTGSTSATIHVRYKR